MPKINSLFPLAGCAILAAAGTVLLLERSAAQQAEPLAELRTLKQLPTEANERGRIADLAVRLIPQGAPAFLLHSYHNSLLAPGFISTPPKFVPVPEPAKKLSLTCQKDHIYSQGNFPSVIHKNGSDADSAGCEGTYVPTGPVTTSTNAFFASLGTNGRSCATCHQPPGGMSVSKDNIVARLEATHGTDSIFAGVDGANCPSNLPPYTGNGAAFKAAHSLLLQRGLFRISLQVPAGAEFTVSAVGHDPYGCNTTPPYNEDTVNGETVQMVSAYRRPRISANLTFVLSAFTPVAPGTPPTPGGTAAIMWDLRETSLNQQTIDATFGGHAHAQGTVIPTTNQINEMVAFEKLYSAQVKDNHAGDLDAAGAKGGPVALSMAPTGQNLPPATIAFDEYASWSSQSGHKASIARGEILFNTKKFKVSDVAGVNDVPGVGNPLVATCSGCHSQGHAGNDIFGGNAKMDTGTAGDSVAHNGPPPSPELPIFTVTCASGKSTPYNGSTVTTNDLGVAMISKLCTDIGKFSVPQLRALVSHPPFFHDGAAKTLGDVVKFYDKRFSIGFTSQERDDLVHFLEAL